MELPPVVGRLVGDTTDFSSKFGAATTEAESMSSRIGGAMTKVGVVATGAGAALLAMADESKQAGAQARVAVENAGLSFEAFEGKVDSLGRKMIQLGHDDEAATRAFASLATTLQDPQKALDNMGLVADIAAAKHISLEAAADRVGKMYAGNNKIFKEFGIEVAKGASEQERAAAIAELASRVQGQAAAQADTFGNKLHVLKETAANFAEEFGAKFGGAIAVAGPMIGGLGQIIESGLVPKLISGIAAGARFAVSMVASGLSAAQAAIPVIVAWAPVILTIAAIGAAAFLLWKNWDTVWGFIKGAAQVAADFVGRNLEWIAAAVLLPIAPLILLLSNWDTVWGAIKGATSAAASFVGDRISDIIGFFAALPGRILGALGDMGSLLFEAGRDLLRGLMNGITSMVGAAVDAVKGAVGSVVSGAKRLLGIGSPSKVFMEFGRDTMRGYAIGLEKETPTVDAAIGAGLPVGSVGGGGGAPRGADLAPRGTTVIQLVVEGRVLAEVVRDELIRMGDRVPSLFGGRA